MRGRPLSTNAVTLLDQRCKIDFTFVKPYIQLFNFETANEIHLSNSLKTLYVKPLSC